MNAELLTEGTVKEIITKMNWGQNLQESFSLVMQDYIFQCIWRLLHFLSRFLQRQLLERKANTAKSGIPPSSEQQHPYKGTDINNNKNVTRLLKQTQPNDNKNIERPFKQTQPPAIAPCTIPGNPFDLSAS